MAPQRSGGSARVADERLLLAAEQHQDRADDGEHAPDRRLQDARDDVLPQPGNMLLDRGLLAEAGPDWRVADFRPGNRPSAALTTALIAAIGGAFSDDERAVIETRLTSGEALTLVPVAAILVASLRLHCIDRTLNAQTRGPTVFPCDTDVHKGDELGWFEHGSTIIVLTPDHFEFCPNVREGARIKAGQPLLRKPQ